MLDDLKAKDLSDDTLIVIYSDHKNYSSNFITEKYSENIEIEEYDYDRIPFAIYHPSLEAKEFTNITSHYDITPTIFDLLGIKYIKEYYYGQSVFLDKDKSKPLIFGFNRWIDDNMIVYDKEIVYYNPDFTIEKVEKYNMDTLNSVYATINKFHAFFLTDFFRETALEE
jgi:phosphoglycerol transferase MdoB-like AlkP superfamily enzyme